MLKFRLASRLLALLLLIPLCFSCATKEISTTEAVTMALELSGIYVKNQEYDKAIATLERATEFSSDVRIYQNLVLIYKEQEKYDKALEVALATYRANPYVESLLRTAIELAIEQKNEELQKELYADLFAMNAINITDLVYIIKEVQKTGDRETLIRLIDYGIRWQLYNKEFFELAKEVTGNEDYEIAGKYLKT